MVCRLNYNLIILVQREREPTPEPQVIYKTGKSDLN